MSTHRHQPKHIRWQSLGFGVLAALIVTGLLATGLDSIAPHLTATESATIRGSGNLHVILTDPLHLPLKLLQWMALRLPASHETLAARLPGVLLAVTAFCIFLYITRRWYGRRSMVLGCLLFATSAWFLHVGRFAGPDIEYVTGLLALLAVHIGLYDYDDRPLMFYGWLVVHLALLFIPGFVWFVLLSAGWQWRAIVTSWRRTKPAWLRVPWAILLAAGATAVAWPLVMHTGLVRPWLGLTASLPPATTLLRHISNSFTALVWQAPHNPELWLGRLPLLDVFLTVMLAAGCAFYARHWRAPRTRLLASFLLLGGILAGLGQVPLSIMLPVAYIVITGGVAYALHFWLRRFPRNPLARGTGIGILALLALVSCGYNLSQYFIAWPHSPDTKAVMATAAPQR